MTTVVFGDNTGDDPTGDNYDTRISEGAATTNRGTDTTGEITYWTSSDRHHFLLEFTGISTLGSITVSSATIGIYGTSVAYGDPVTVNAHKLLRNWTESGATWNKYDGTNNWTTAGADDTTNDRSSTLTASITWNNTAEYKTFSSAQLATDAQNMASSGNYGWRFSAGATASRAANHETAEGTDGHRPYISLTYTASGGSSVTLTPLAGNVAWNGKLATLKTLYKANPAVGNIAWNGKLATIKTLIKLGPSAGNVAWNGGASTLKTFYRVSPLAGLVQWNGQLPTVDSKIMVSLSPYAGNVSWNGGLPTTKTVYKISPAAGAINWNGGLPTVSFPSAFAWTAVSRASTSWNPVARTTQTWTRIQRDGSTLWTTRERPYDTEV